MHPPNTRWPGLGGWALDAMSTCGALAPHYPVADMIFGNVPYSISAPGAFQRRQATPSTIALVSSTGRHTRPRPTMYRACPRRRRNCLQALRCPSIPGPKPPGPQVARPSAQLPPRFRHAARVANRQRRRRPNWQAVTRIAAKVAETTLEGLTPSPKLATGITMIVAGAIPQGAAFPRPWRGRHENSAPRSPGLGITFTGTRSSPVSPITRRRRGRLPSPGPM